MTKDQVQKLLEKMCLAAFDAGTANNKGNAGRFNVLWRQAQTMMTEVLNEFPTENKEIGYKMTKEEFKDRINTIAYVASQVVISRESRQEQESKEQLHALIGSLVDEFFPSPAEIRAITADQGPTQEQLLDRLRQYQDLRCKTMQWRYTLDLSLQQGQTYVVTIISCYTESLEKYKSRILLAKWIGYKWRLLQIIDSGTMQLEEIQGTVYASPEDASISVLVSTENQS